MANARRYEVRAIREPSADTIESLGEMLASFDTLEEAKEIAVAESVRIYGSAVVDPARRTIDWGSEVTDYQGESLQNGCLSE